MTTAYLVPLISRYVEWADESDEAVTKPQGSWLSFDAISRLAVAKKGPKRPTAELLDFGPYSIRMIIVCTSARNAENIARKCRGLVPNVAQGSNTPQRPKEDIAVVCLTHSQPKQSEREAVLSRRAHILVTVCVQPCSLSCICPEIRIRSLNRHLFRF